MALMTSLALIPILCMFEPSMVVFVCCLMPTVVMSFVNTVFVFNLVGQFQTQFDMVAKVSTGPMVSVRNS